MAFADNAELLKGACGKSLASFPQGGLTKTIRRSFFFLTVDLLTSIPLITCLISFLFISTGCFFSTAVGELRSFENPKNKITAVPAKEEEIWGATFKVTMIV